MIKTKILLVENDRLMQAVYDKIFEGQDMIVERACHFKEAVKKLQDSDYDVVILDTVAGDSKGVEILKILENRKDIIKIMTAGSADSSIVIESFNLGADAFFQKPFNSREFLNTVKRKLQTKLDRLNLSEEIVSKWLEQRFNSLAY